MTTVYHITVKGRVQGVGFRFFADLVARRLGVGGWVKNMPNGDVEILARLPPDVYTRFITEIRRGPPMSHVISIDVQEAASNLACPEDSFSITH